MTKYNINYGNKKEAVYRSLVNPKLMNELKGQIISILLKRKKYKDKEYSAKRLAEDLHTNTRYVSAVVNVCFDMNYTSLVNKYRVDNAKLLLTDKRYAKLRMEEISDLVGFSNRQSFYAAFYKYTGLTPRQYELDNTKN
ncbi:putative response regulator [Prevotella sp. CAG:1124]|nr:putative response regulator [Prevotella sp. CAG:1124]